jgi:hypothetical protein
MKKLVRISTVIDTIYKVLQVFCWILVVMSVLLTLFATVAAVIRGNISEAYGMYEVELGQVAFEFAPEYSLNFGWVLAFSWFSVPAAVFLLVCVRLTRKILCPMKEGRPFDLSVGVNIRKIGYASLALGVVQNACLLFNTYAVMHVFRSGALHVGGALKSITVNYTPDLTCLGTFLVLLLVSHIFNYGAQLQQQSDETL